MKTIHRNTQLPCLVSDHLRVFCWPLPEIFDVIVFTPFEDFLWPLTSVRSAHTNPEIKNAYFRYVPLLGLSVYTTCSICIVSTYMRPILPRLKWWFFVNVYSTPNFCEILYTLSTPLLRLIKGPSANSEHSWARARRHICK